VAFSETVECRTRTLLACFNEMLEGGCGHCDTCDAPPRTLPAVVEAQKALSAVHRTGQVFGALHVIAVLRGERTEAVLRHRHDRLGVFGLGADRPAAFWRGLLRQLIGLGALDVDTEGHGGLFLVSDKARPLLRGEVEFRVRADAPLPRPAPAAPTGPAPEAPATQAEQALFEALRAWRAQEAKAQSVPPYVIFHDTVLRGIAASQPADMETLGSLKGVGASKLARYGTAVLAIVRGSTDPERQ